MPLAFVLLSGNVTHDKIMLCNNMVVDWQVRIKKKKFKEGDCPWYQPNTQAVLFRTFISHMGKKHSWNIGESDLKGFEGCLNAVLKETFAQRYETWVSNHVINYLVIRTTLLMLTVTRNIRGMRKEIKIVPSLKPTLQKLICQNLTKVIPCNFNTRCL